MPTRVKSLLYDTFSAGSWIKIWSACSRCDFWIWIILLELTLMKLKMMMMMELHLIKREVSSYHVMLHVFITGSICVYIHTYETWCVSVVITCPFSDAYHAINNTHTLVHLHVSPMHVHSHTCMYTCIYGYKCTMPSYKNNFEEMPRNNCYWNPTRTASRNLFCVTDWCSHALTPYSI